VLQLSTGQHAIARKCTTTVCNSSRCLQNSTFFISNWTPRKDCWWHEDSTMGLFVVLVFECLAVHQHAVCLIISSCVNFLIGTLYTLSNMNRLDHYNTVLARLPRSTIAPLQWVRTPQPVLWRILVYVITSPDLERPPLANWSNSASCSNYVYWCT